MSTLSLRLAQFVVAVGVIAAVSACAPHTPPQVTAADAERGNVEIAELQQGRKLLLGKCAGCHRTPLPADHTPAEWPTKLAEMAGRANLDGTQTRLIEKYLVVMSQRPMTAASN